jgi:late competence protein required for DNA uptake (superfamily II DNA/RNA helicase)
MGGFMPMVAIAAALVARDFPRARQLEFEARKSREMRRAEKHARRVTGQVVCSRCKRGDVTLRRTSPKPCAMYLCTGCLEIAT